MGNYEGKDATFSDDYGNLGMTHRQQVNDNLLLVNQIMTNWGLTDRLSVDAGASYNMVRGYEPDRRINQITRNETGYGLVGGNTQFRTFSSLTENDLNLRAGVVYRLKDDWEEISRLRFGYTGRIINDDFKQTEYNMVTLNGPSFTSVDDISLDDFYSAAHFNDRFTLDNAVDKYAVKKNIHSVYAEAVYQFTRHWVINLGLKYDNVDMTVDYNVDKGNSKGKNNIRKNYFLPSLNIRYRLNDKNALRLGLSKTYTLPQSKEISPYRYVGVNFKSQGNANLKPSDNYNIDLKWDFNPTSTELISVTAFYKMIKNPISRIETPSAGGFLSYENVADQATVTGIELEIRKKIFSRPTANNGMNRLTAGLNGSYIYTNAKVNDPNIAATDTDGSQLEGAAPWIANFDLSHTYVSAGYSFTNTLVLGYVGEKVYTIGTQGFQDVMEEGVATLDFVSQAKLGKHIALTLKARNASVIARNIYSALSELDSANEPYFKHRLDSLQQIIAQTDTDVRDRLQNADTTFLIYHPALSYFARDYGLKQISIEEGGKEPSPAHLKELIETCRRDNARVIFVQQEFDTRNARLIADELGVTVVPINPLSYEWREEMINVANALAK